MNTIALPTSTEMRAALEKAGWYLLDPRAIRLERWCHDEPNANILMHYDDTLPIIGDDCDFFKVLEFATILGIHPEGHRIVAAKILLRAHQICDMYVNLAQVVAKVDVACLVKDTKTALAVALGVAPPPPLPSEKGGPSPSPKERQDAAKAEIVDLVEAAAQGYDVDKMTRELDAFFSESNEGAEPREEETP